MRRIFREITITCIVDDDRFYAYEINLSVNAIVNLITELNLIEYRLVDMLILRDTLDIAIDISDETEDKLLKIQKHKNASKRGIYVLNRDGIAIHMNRNEIRYLLMFLLKYLRDNDMSKKHVDLEFESSTDNRVLDISVSVGSIS